MLYLVMAVAVLLAFSVGCGVSGATKLKCPKCGAVFTVDEATAYGKRTAP